MPVVSIIVASYNLGEYLGETLRSVQDQTFREWECLIVDNGSTDNSLQVLADYCSADPRFVPVVIKENIGVAAARNRGIELAKGQYLLFLDADDLIMPEYLALAVSALDEDPSLTIVYGKAERFGAERTWDLPPFSIGTMLARNCLYISCVFRRDQAVLFDPSFKVGYEDWDYWLSLLERVDSPKVFQIPSLCFRYRTRRRSRNTFVTDEALKEIRKRLWEKHKGLYSKYFCNPLETVEFKRMEQSFRKASRWSIVWKIRLLYRRLF